MFKKHRKGQVTGIIGGVIGLVTLVIGLVIVDDVVKEQTFNSSLSETVKNFIVPLGMLGGLALAAGIAFYGFRR